MTDQVAVEVPIRAARVEARHAGAALLGEMAAINADIRRAQQIREERDGQVMFRQRTGQEVELAGDVDTQSIDRAIASRSDQGDKDSPQRAEGEGKTTKLEAVKKAVTEIKEGNVSQETVNLVASRLARIPGVCAGLAVELGIEPDQVKTQLVAGINGGDRLDEMIRSHLAQETFIGKLVKAFNGAQLSADIEGLEDEIASLLELTKAEKDRIDASRTKIRKAKDEYYTYTEDTKLSYDEKIKKKKDWINRLTSVSDRLLGGGLDFNDVEDVKRFIREVPQFIPTDTADPANAETRRYLEMQLSNAEKLIALLEDSDLNKYLKAREANETWLQLDQQEKELRRQQNALRKKETERRTALESYENKILPVLDRTVGGYWNEIILDEAVAVAQAEASQKAEDKAKAKERGEAAETMLDSFMMLSFHKYKYDAKSRGQVSDGWDDSWIKDMVNQSVGHGPQAMAENFIRHLLARRNQMPEDIRRNIEEALGKINKDNPGDPLSALDSEALRRIGKKFVPLLWGAGEIRGFTLGRRKITGPQALTLTLEYGDDFWQQVSESGTRLQTLLDSHYGKNTTEASKLGKRIREEFSADNISQNKLAFLLKLLGLIGSAGLIALIPSVGPLLAGGALAGGVATLTKLKSKS